MPFIFLSREMPQIFLLVVISVLPLPYHTLHIVLFPLQKDPKSLGKVHTIGTHIGFFVIIVQSYIARYVAQKSGSIVPHHHKKITFDFSLHDACRHQPIFLRVLG